MVLLDLVIKYYYYYSTVRSRNVRFLAPPYLDDRLGRLCPSLALLSSVEQWWIPMGAIGRLAEPIVAVGMAAVGLVDPCQQGQFTPVMGSLGLTQLWSSRETCPFVRRFCRRRYQLQSDIPVLRRINLGPTPEQKYSAGGRSQPRRCCTSSILRVNVQEDFKEAPDYLVLKSSL